jgi:hypothetical protein
VDPNAHDSLDVHTYVDGVFAGVTHATGVRPDVAAAVPQFGPAHGFTLMLHLFPGPHSVCVYGINVGAGTNALIDCVNTTVSNAPFGALDGTVRAAAVATVSGWVIDPTTPSAAQVRVTLDGALVTTQPATVLRPDLPVVFPLFGGEHGYLIAVAVSPGPHTICVVGLGGPGAPSTGLGCRSI